MFFLGESFVLLRAETMTVARLLRPDERRFNFLEPDCSSSVELAGVRSFSALMSLRLRERRRSEVSALVLLVFVSELLGSFVVFFPSFVSLPWLPSLSSATSSVLSIICKI